MSMMLNFSLVMYMNDSFMNLLKFLNFLLELQIQDVEQILQSEMCQSPNFRVRLASSTSYFPAYTSKSVLAFCSHCWLPQALTREIQVLKKV